MTPRWRADFEREDTSELTQNGIVAKKTYLALLHDLAQIKVPLSFPRA